LIDDLDKLNGGQADGVCFESCTEDNDCGALVINDYNPYLVNWKCISNICTPTCDNYGNGCFDTYAGQLYCNNNLCTLRKPYN
jgi:hypothetical protein